MTGVRGDDAPGRDRLSGGYSVLTDAEGSCVVSRADGGAVVRVGEGGGEGKAVVVRLSEGVAVGAGPVGVLVAPVGVLLPGEVAGTDAADR
ncbi:hypothetical protein, partial [Streptomyces violarus]|uniref:hypothetical protein n=1 Tax=Streptomyces violarus TaxID=67380 RepID=UPI0021C0F7CB